VRLKGVLTILAILAYAVAAHAAFAPGRPTPVAAAMALLPLGCAVVLLAWTSRWRLPVLAVLGAAAVALVWWWPARGLDVSAVYLLQYLALHAALCTLFARTLWPGHEPLVTRLARAVHGELPKPIARYTRAVTLAWAVFFAAMGLVALLLYLAAPRAAWSAFVNLTTLPAVAAMFAAEYLVRRRRFPWFEHVSILAGVTAFQRAFGRRAP
jgi:uncharacterized membrane protein